VIFAAYNFVPVQKRGYQFRDTTYASIENLILFHSFNARFWVKGAGRVLEVHNDYEAEMLVLSVGSELGFLFQKGDANWEFSSQSVSDAEWRLITLMIDYQSPVKTEVEVFQNTSLQVHTVIPTSFIDSPYNKHLVYFSGFVYSVEFDQEIDLDFTKYIGRPCGKLYCTVCPIDVCLLDCDWN
jgi:hypothetical protein